MRILNQLRAIFVVVTKRLGAQLWLVGATTLGLVIAIALLLSIPLYADAIYQRIFMKNITPEGWADPNTPPPFTFLFRYDGSIYGAVEWEKALSVDEYLSKQAGIALGLPEKFLVRYFSTDPFGIYPVPEGAFNDTGTPLLWASFAWMSDFQDHVNVLEGTFPSVSAGGSGSTVDVMIYENKASELGVQVGETFIAFARQRSEDGFTRNVQIPIRIVGVWKEQDVTDPYWFFSPTTLAERLIVPEETYTGRLGDELNGEVYTAAWYLVMDGQDFSHDDTLTLLRRATITQQKAGGLLTNVKLAKSPVDAMVEYRRSANTLTILLYAFSVPILALLLAFITLTSGLAVDRRRNEIAVLRSRGAMALQMVGIALLEGLLLGLVALAVGIPTGMSTAQFIGQARSFLDFSAGLGQLRLNVSASTLRFGLVGVALVVAAQVIPTLGAAGHTVVSYKREVARLLRPPWWQRAWLDVLLFIPSAYGAYLLREQGSLVLLQDAFGTNPLQNPLLFLVPALGIFSLTLLFLRFMPLLMALITWVATHTRAVGLLMAARHLSRTPGLYSTPLILLVLTLSLSAFTASLAYTLDQHLYDQRYYQIGADMNFLEQGEGQDDSMAAMYQPSSESTSSAEEEDEGPRWYFLPVTDYLNVPGVQAVTRVGRYPATTRFSNATQIGVFMGIDRGDFGQIAFWRKDFSHESLGALMNALAVTRNGVLIYKPLMDQHALYIGDTIHVIVTMYGQNTEVELQIVGTFDLFPTWYPSEGPLFVGNLDYLFEEAGGQFPYTVWLKTAPGADLASLGAKGLSATRMLSWRASALEIAAEQELPQRQGLFGLLSVGFAAAAVLTVLGFLLYALFSFRRRFIEFGVLRAVGLSAGQMAAYLGWELAFLILMGGGLGTLLGGGVSAFFIPFLQIGVDEAARIPPYVVDIAWPAIFRIYVLFGTLFFVALAALVVMLRRMKIFEAVKLGETA
ncbi:MAG TPA: ABC transporter permease [Anaerolineae bacterium]|nr:ABC transporter permease [Anaerolineae bacterium]